MWKENQQISTKGVVLELHYKYTDFLTHPTWQSVSTVLAKQEHMQFLKLHLLPN